MYTKGVHVQDSNFLRKLSGSSEKSKTVPKYPKAKPCKITVACTLQGTCLLWKHGGSGRGAGGGWVACIVLTGRGLGSEH